MINESHIDLTTETINSLRFLKQQIKYEMDTIPCEFCRKEFNRVYDDAIWNYNRAMVKFGIPQFSAQIAPIDTLLSNCQRKHNYKMNSECKECPNLNWCWDALK